jgi:hypothetical protein
MKILHFLACFMMLVSFQAQEPVVERVAPDVAKHRADAASPDSNFFGTTKGIIDFQRPGGAVQLVSQSDSQMIPESSAKCAWTFKDGVLTASTKWDSVVTPDAYRDFRMHLEFKLNETPTEPRETSGNSGVYLQQRYEIQILNSHGVAEAEYQTDDCGSIYGMKKPDKRCCKPPGEWQSFDIAFRAARFDGGGKKTENARVTVYHNEELIHDDYAIPDKSGAGKPEENSARPVKLQGHHNPVQFRNVWIQELSLGDQDSAVTVPQITTSQKKLPLSGEVFQLNGSDAFLISPKSAREADTGLPWVWYAPTLPGLPAKEELWMFEQFLNAGIAIAGIDVGESYGSPKGRKKYDAFYSYLTTTRTFSGKPCLLARSRGGLMHYSWAVDNPQRVAGVAGIYPVCNIASYPGIEKACSAFELSAEQLQAELTRHNPIDRLKPLAELRVPVFHIHGDQDNVVPLNDNSGLLAERYRRLGGGLELEVVQGQGHNLWDGWFQSERLVEFVGRCLGRPIELDPVDRIELIERAVERLVEIQETDGAWPYEGVYRVGGKIPVGYRVGGTSIVCCALLGAPIKDRQKADEAIRRGVALILTELEHPLMKRSTINRYDVRVWGHIYALELLVRLKTCGRFADLERDAQAWIEKLVPILVEEQLDDGGWNYASRNQHATFVTAPALQALMLAHKQGVEVETSVFDRGLKALTNSRGRNGAFSYSGTTAVMGGGEKIPGSIARNAVCEATLLMFDQGDLQHLQTAIDGFYEHWDELEKRRKKTGTHLPPYGIAPYYFYYGHRYLAQALEMLPAESREKEFERFEVILRKTMDDDHTWNDRVFERSRAFGTAMSILALSRSPVNPLR